MDDADKRESDAAEQTPPKIKAEENPWYLLATLYGVPQARDDELKAKNRIAWNRYFAANLDEEARTKLIEAKRHPAEELTPFSPDELREVETRFAERSKASAKKPALPASSAGIDFSNVDFEHDAFLIRCLFSGYAYFKGATFSGGADFDGATFSGQADFEGATFFSFQANFKGAAFSGGAYFYRATFSGAAAHFEGATFSDGASFAGATFSGWANFYGATFPGWASFRGAAISGPAVFRGATFSGRADFGGAAFSREASFDGATFSRGANFGKVALGEEIRVTSFGGTASFVNAEMKDETSFERAIFEKEPPRFFGAKLHQGTVWRGIKWPLPKNKDEAGTFIDAYACLKLEMDRLKKHEDELDFFALELQSRRVLQESVLKGSGLSIALYGFVSDYGRSYARPLHALFAVAVFGTLMLLLSSKLAPWQSPGLSIANTLNVFGFRKDFFDAATIERLPTPLKILAAVQTILGAILLFLFGLGIRNKFRMK